MTSELADRVASICRWFSPYAQGAAAVLLGLACFLNGTAFGRPLQASGTLIVKKFGHHDELVSAAEGSYELLSDGNKYAIRMLKPAEYVEQQLLAISDGKSIYQAEQLRELNSNRPPEGPFAIASVKCNWGNMPVAYSGWSTVEALAFVLVSNTSPGSVFDDSGQIKEAYIPGIIKTRSREVDWPRIQTDVKRGQNGKLDAVIFWGLPVSANAKANPFTKEPGRFCLGILEMKDYAAGLPQEISFTLNSIHRTDKEDLKYETPFVTVIMRGEIHPTNDIALFTAKAYRSGTRIGVRDTRFSEGQAIEYELRANDALPLFGNENLEGSAPLRRLAMQSEFARKANASKTMLACAAVLLSSASIWVYKIKQKKRSMEINETKN